MSPSKQSLDALRIARAPQAARKNSPATLSVLLVAFTAIAVAAWWYQRPPVFQVRTAVVSKPASAGEQTLLNASGYVTARVDSTVSSKVTGKVVEVFIEEGMAVEANQVLARTDSSNLEKNLRLTEAQLQATRKMLDETKATMLHAERELRRVSQLAASRVASQAELDKSETEVISLRARLERQIADIRVKEVDVEVWQQQVEDTIIRAPFAGIVTTKDAQPGEMISPISAGGGFTRTGICTIVDMSSLEIEVDVNESYINRVEAGQSVVATLDAYPDWKIPARVIAIIPTANRQKATVKVRVGFDKLDARILPQMSVKVSFRGSESAAAASQPSTKIPASALARDQDQDIVWVVKAGLVERRAVSVGEKEGDEVSILAGLETGERIVVSGTEMLADKARIVEIK
ncbi:MAG: efflux RND transporter periplasmic adaptor subunit [Planctomycetes bacterium]|nr:efflux RND transporter periplasmic adaptor subunit [Planctomycetota bacterium]